MSKEGCLLALSLDERPPPNVHTFAGYVLNVTSQRWLTRDDFDFSSFDVSCGYSPTVCCRRKQRGNQRFVRFVDADPTLPHSQGREVGHLWWHIVTVIVPSNLRSAKRSGDQGFVFVSGGTNTGSGIPSEDGQDVSVVSYIAMETGSIGSVVNQVNNQPIVFSSDPDRRRKSEDAVIAWT